MLKRIFTIILSVVIFSEMCSGYYATETVYAEEIWKPEYWVENVTINKGQNRTFELEKNYNTDITVEIDYNLENSTWDGECNIPMILLDPSNAEIGRISIYSKDYEILSTRMENGTIVNAGGIERKGTLIIESDFENKRLIFKTKGADYKPTATLGYIPFANEDVDGVAKIKVGAGGNPGITLNIRVYNGISETMTTEYKFENEYQGSLSLYNDFSGSGISVVLANGPQKQDNKAVFVPEDKVLRMNYMPIDCGFSGKIGISYMVYISSDDINNMSIGGLNQYIKGSTTEIVGMTAVDNRTLNVSADGKKYRVVTEKNLANRWIKIEYFLDLDNKKANIRADGKIITSEDGSAAIPISDFKIFNQIYAKASADMYVDDICIISGKEEINAYSNLFNVDNGNRRISGIDMRVTAADLLSFMDSPNCTMKVVSEDDSEICNGIKTTDSLAVTGKSGYTVYYSMEFINYNIDFEGTVKDGFTGGTICTAPYGRTGNVVKSDSDVANNTVTVQLPNDKEYDTVEFDVCFENNTAQAYITINNDNNRQFSKMYLLNQETISFLVGNSSYNHAVTTKDRTWQRFKAVIDRENNSILWYMDGRALQTEPFGFSNLYDGENTLSSISVSVSEGAYAYIDNVFVSNSSEGNICVSSDIYNVDNEYKMITGVKHETIVNDFLANIVPDGRVISKDGGVRAINESIKIGDSIRFYDNNIITEYAIGVENAEKKSLLIDNTTSIYVSSNGDDSNTGTESSPYKTLEYAFEKAALIDGDVNIEIIGESFSGDNYIKNINKKNGILILTSKAVITGGIGIERSEFRPLNSEEKKIFSAAPDKILCTNIDINVGKTRQSGWNLPFLPTSAQLLINGETKTIARYPNEGYIKSGEIISSSSTGLTFKYTDNMADNWKNAEHARIWSHFDITYGGHDVPISGINLEDKTIYTSGTMYSASIKNPIDYYVYNIPEELDAPGEYYIDEVGGILYYYPEGDDNFRAVLTQSNSALLRFENCSDIIIDGIRFEGGRGNGIEISDCENLIVKNCEVSGQGMNGIVITDGSCCGITESKIHHTDGDAIKLYGGDMYTLSEANHYVTKCDIHDFSLRKKSYTSAVTTSGCGIDISENRIYNAPHTGLFLRSCETDISKNRFENLTYDAEDMGVVYSVDTYIRRGIRVHDNYFEGIQNRYKSGTGLVKCIYLDNFTSGWEIKNNVFYDCDQGVHANGGRENIITDNLFISTDLPLGMYNLSQSAYISAPLYQSGFEPLGSEVWKNHYDGIDEFAVLFPKQPYGTVVADNVIVGAKKNKLKFDGFMNISASATLSADSIKDGLICDFIFCDENVKPITENVISDRVVIDGLIPFCGVMYIKKGETKDIEVMLDGKIHPAESIETSNETKIRITDSQMTGVNSGIVKLTVKCKDFSQTISVICE